MLKNVLNSLLVLALSSVLPSFAADLPKVDLSHGVRIGGYMNNIPIVVLPDRTAVQVEVGGRFGAVKLVSLDNTTATIEYGGRPGKISLDPSWQLAPEWDLNIWQDNYTTNAGKRIDSKTPTNTQRDVFKIMQNGAATSGLVKIQQAIPFERLPDYLESITVVTQLQPHEPTVVKIKQMTVTPAAYARLVNPLYTMPKTAQ